MVLWAWKHKKAMVSEILIFSAEFYENKIHAMPFYFKYELLKQRGLRNPDEQGSPYTEYRKGKYLLIIMSGGVRKPRKSGSKNPNN